MAPRTLLAGTAGLIGLLAVACFVDRPHDGASGSSGTAASEASTGAGGGSTTGQAATGTGEATSGSTTGTGETTTSATTIPGTTSTADPTGPTDPTTMGSICAPADGFPNIDPPECRACLAMNCCVPVSDCAADPACSPAWSSTQSQPCISRWQSCPGYAEQKGKLDTISACAEAQCPGVCALGPCAAEKAVCQQNPECQAVDACVQANCNAACPADQPDCFLPCWAMCQDQHPNGAQQWAALIMCYDGKCP